MPSICSSSSRKCADVQFVPLRIPEVVLVKPRVFGDQRGYLIESWQESAFAAAGLRPHFVQDNHSHSQPWVLRGLHYQRRQAQGKLVRAARGAVFDVAVDIRPDSPTFGQWVGAELSDSNHHMLWLPPGFAHGFLALATGADVIYKCTDFYAPEHERVIRWDDPAIGIQWPLAAGVQPQLSARDSQGVALRDAELP
jgi:dTDP-4-dehydrorhamnose 3,5-epimerase